MSSAGKVSGLLYIISAPSGAGKTSLVKALLACDQDIAVSVSHTTRSPRPGEVDSEDYFFTKQEVFKQQIDQQAFIEYAEVFDHYYGTEKKQVDRQLACGQDVILEIDWQGARQVRQVFPQAVSVFILPPSKQALESRLKNRGQDHDDVIKRRMQDAQNETSHYDEYDYLLVNDDFEQALQELQLIFSANRLRLSSQQVKLHRLISDLMDYSTD